ncbi:helix-turn-helix domain-containing protein [Larkinella soli]|uniref:helix-turn-helix domain-containing protein n=1 Tax=Larkinella soli TaxID=1770527 RepID=UPI000FFBD574|nr:helix-turn-helix domain-containing protein [Larkinella soli]
MRNIKNLTVQEVDLLRQTIRESQNNVLKKRCQCVLYSYYGLTVSELMEMFSVDRRSIYNWMNRWQKGGLQGLQDKPGRGLKPKLNPADKQHVEKVMQALMSFPKEPRQVLQQINHQLPKPISQDTLRRFVKKISRMDSLAA